MDVLEFEEHIHGHRTFLSVRFLPLTKTCEDQ